MCYNTACWGSDCFGVKSKSLYKYKLSEKRQNFQELKMSYSPVFIMLLLLLSLAAQKTKLMPHVARVRVSVLVARICLVNCQLQRRSAGQGSYHVWLAPVRVQSELCIYFRSVKNI